MPSASEPIVTERGPAGNRLVVATAGHVDHGKTRLVQALTGVDTDRLPEEKRRGISIELGFAELAGTGVSLVDVPGHERLVHTMIAGASGVDWALLVVAADEGVMPQTREHLGVCSVLGVRHALLAVTKCDLVDAETAGLCAAEATAAAGALGIAIEGEFRTSAVSGAGIDELRAALAALPQRVPARPERAHAWLALDRVFSLRGAGTVVTGTLTRGELWRDRPVFVVGNGRLPTSCRALEVHGRAAERVRAPSRVAVNLARLKVGEVPRGAVLSSDERLCLSQRWGVLLRVLPGADAELVPHRPLMVHLGTARSPGRLMWRAADVAELCLERPLPAAAGLVAVLRGAGPRTTFGRLLGGAFIVDADAQRARRKEIRELSSRAWRALGSGELRDGLLALLQAAAPRSLERSELERRAGLQPGSASAYAAEEVLAAGDRWLLRAALHELSEAALVELRRFHEQKPHERGLSIETLRESLRRRSDAATSELVLQALLTTGAAVALDGGVLALARELDPGAVLRDRAREALAQKLAAAGLEGAPEDALAAATGGAIEQTRAALNELARGARARRLGGLWFDESALEDLRRRVRQHFERKATLSVPELKALAGVSRKQAIPLLEQLDREGTTRRQGDDRVAGARPAG